MFEVRLHGALWRTVSSARGREWRTALEEINTQNRIAADGFGEDDDPALELVRRPEGTYQFRIYRNGFELEHTIELDDERLQRLFDEYGATIRQMVHVDREAPVRGFEALDYAKRVVHDEGADYLLERLRPPLSFDLTDARRLFTLVFLVGTDIPEELVRYHRFH